MMEVIYKEIRLPIMMIKHTIFARSNTIFADQNASLLSNNIMEEILMEILLNQDDRPNKFFLLDHLDQAEFLLNLFP